MSQNFQNYCTEFLAPSHWVILETVHGYTLKPLYVTTAKCLNNAYLSLLLILVQWC